MNMDRQAEQPSPSKSMIWQKILWAAIAVQLIAGMVMVEEYFLYHSHMRMFMNQTMTRKEKMDAVLGGDYPVHIRFSTIPENTSILIIASDPYFFCNYYFLPRRIYTYPGLTRDEDMRIPREWIDERNITLLFSYHIPYFMVLQKKPDGSFR